MSEYWKSTPKYWCKHCKTYVRDTGLEKKNHEATGRHQGNLQRFLRGLHKDNDREQRETQRAKDEADRLNGVIKKPGPSELFKSTSTARGPLTPADRKRQLEQLADMGVAVPEDFRKESAMAGEWQTVSRRIITDPEYGTDNVKKEEDGQDSKTLNIGVRKRTREEEEEAEERVVKKGWGSKTRAYPGSGGGDDLDALLSKAKARDPQSGEAVDNTKSSDNTKTIDDGTVADGQLNAAQEPPVGGEEPVGSLEAGAKTLAESETTPAEKIDDLATPNVMFKKRKGKAARGINAGS